MKRHRTQLKKLYDVLEILQIGKQLPNKHRQHRLKGEWSGYWECHIEHDWLLIWTEDENSIYLTRTGSHSDLFK